MKPWRNLNDKHVESRVLKSLPLNLKQNAHNTDKSYNTAWHAWQGWVWYQLEGYIFGSFHWYRWSFRRHKHPFDAVVAGVQGSRRHRNHQLNKKYIKLQTSTSLPMWFHKYKNTKIGYPHGVVLLRKVWHFVVDELSAWQMYAQGYMDDIVLLTRDKRIKICLKLF